MAIGSIIFIGFIGNMIFLRYKVPDVLILIGVGMVVGPDLLGERFDLISYQTLADIDDFRNVFLAAALVIILFDGGLNLDFRAVVESMRLSLFLSVSGFTLSVLGVATGLYFIVGVDLLQSLLLGATIGGTSGAIVIPIVTRMRVLPRTKALLTMESTITDVLVIVAALTIISVMKVGEVNFLLVTKDLVSKFVVGGLVGFGAGVAWLFALQRLQREPLSYMITIAMLFLVAGLVEMKPLESSGAVAALAFGLSIGNQRFVRRRLSSVSLRFSTDMQLSWFHSQITFFVRSFFFVYLGLFFRFDTFTGVHLVLGLLAISMIVLVRWIATLMVWKVGDLSAGDAGAVFALMPRGLAAAVLATLPALELAGVLVGGEPIWTDEIGYLFLNTTLIVILGTTVLATVFSFATEQGIERRIRLKMKRELVEGS